MGKEIWGDTNFEWAYRGAEGRSGGLISIWNSNVFAMYSLWHTMRMLMVKGKWLEDGSDILIINVYAPCTTTEKEQLWDTLKIVTEEYEEYKICVAGDFNSI
ncbi:hypothetical protein ACS0TY_031022 [Phlomoides rotata]